MIPCLPQIKTIKICLFGFLFFFLNGHCPNFKQSCMSLQPENSLLVPSNYCTRYLDRSALSLSRLFCTQTGVISQIQKSTYCVKNERKEKKIVPSQLFQIIISTALKQGEKITDCNFIVHLYFAVTTNQVLICNLSLGDNNHWASVLKKKQNEHTLYFSFYFHLGGTFRCFSSFMSSHFHTETATVAEDDFPL